MHSMAKFLLELAMVDYGMLQFLPSQQAAAALCVALRLYTDHSIQWVGLHYLSYRSMDLHAPVFLNYSGTVVIHLLVFTASFIH